MWEIRTCSGVYDRSQHQMVPPSSFLYWTWLSGLTLSRWYIYVGWLALHHTHRPTLQLLSPKLPDGFCWCSCVLYCFVIVSYTLLPLSSRRMILICSRRYRQRRTNCRNINQTFSFSVLHFSRVLGFHFVNLTDCNSLDYLLLRLEYSSMFSLMAFEKIMFSHRACLENLSHKRKSSCHKSFSWMWDWKLSVEQWTPCGARETTRNTVEIKNCFSALGGVQVTPFSEAYFE